MSADRKVHTELRVAFANSETLVDIPISLPYDEALKLFREGGVSALESEVGTIEATHKGGLRVAARLESGEVNFAALIEVDDD